MSHVVIHEWESWFSAGGRKESLVAWREGLTVGDLVPAKMKGAPGLCPYRNGVLTADLSTQVAAFDYVDFAVRPGGPGGLITAATWAKASIWAKAGFFLAAGLLASFAINLVLSAIIGKPKGPKKRGDEESPHGAWSGPSNVRVEGQPRMVVYGRFRVAPTVIDEFVVTQTGPPKSTLYSLLTFGEGPISKIGDRATDNQSDTPLSTEDPSNPIPSGIQVEGNALENLRNVEAHVRMGTSQQEAIPGFELIATDYEVAGTLNQAETSGSQQVLNSGLNLTTIPYNSNAASAQALWDLYGVAFDLTNEADQYTSLIEFPAGLFAVNSTGGIIDAGFQVLVRYKELDSLGAPINTGGDNADGWVYQAPEPMLLAREQSAFGKEYSGLFRDPQTYVAGGLGRACFFDGVNDYASTDPAATDTIPNAPASWATGQNMSEITIEGWAQFDGIPSGTTPSYRPLIEISDALNPRGIALFLQRVAFDVGGDTLIGRWIPAIWCGNGAGHAQRYEGDGSAGTNLAAHYIPVNFGVTGWYHLAMTYKRIDASTTRMRAFLNGVQCFSVQSTSAQHRVVSAGKALEMARSRRFQATTFSKVRMDEWRVHQRELTPSEIQTAYSNGAGTYGAPTTDLVAGWHLDEPVATTTAQDFGTFQATSSANDLFLKNGASTGIVGTGIVNTPGTGPARRSKYRVNLLRLNLKTTSSLVQDESVWSMLYGKVDEKLAYPNKPLLALKIQATDQLSGSAPLYTSLVQGKLCPVWDGVSAVAPTITYQWTQNPAWVALDVATNKRYGRGTDFDFTTCDLDSFKEWADYNDEFVYDNRGQKQGIHESTTSFPIFDLRYDSTMFSNYGGIEIHFRTSPAVVEPPSRWAVGRFLGFTGLPATAGSYTVDLMSISGFEIGSILFSSNWRVNIKYDKATYGNPWTDGQFLSTVLAATLVGTVEGREHRFQYDWPHDTFKPAWDTLIDIGMTARAMPLRDGRRLRFKVEKPRIPVGVVTMASIVPHSFEIDYSGTIDRTNSIQADYWDEDRNYDRRNASMDDPTLSTTAAEEEIHRESVTLEGVTRRSQVLRDLYFRLKCNRLLNKSGRFRTGLEALAYEVGDVVQIAHDIVPWGVSGRVATGSTTTAIKLDRTVTLAAATTYFIKVTKPAQRLQGDQVTDHYETRTVTNAAGTYSAGTSITVSLAFTFTPDKDHPWVVYTADQILLAEITEISLTEDFERAIEWVKYDPDIFNVDTLPSDISSSIQSTTGPPVSGRTIPRAPTRFVASENVEMGTDGTWTSKVGVTWTHDPVTSEAVASTVIYIRSGSGWERVAEVAGSATHTNFTPPASLVGTEIEIAVQPRSFLGLALEPDRCSRTRLTLDGAYVGPEAPTNFTATMNGDRVEYSWTPPASARGVTYEARRGGWILGQTVFVAPVGSTTYSTANWAGAALNNWGEIGADIYLRARDSRGQFSDYARIAAFNPSVEGSVALAGFSFEDTAFVSLTVTGGAVATYDGRDVVEFTGSGSTLVLDSSAFFTPTVGRGERLYVEFVCAVDQVPPLTVEQWLLPIDSPRGQRRSVEGALSQVTGESSSCTIVVEYRWRTQLTGPKTAWMPYVPGVVFAVPETFEFRVTITRPDDTYNVRVYRFAYRTSRVPMQRHERTPQRWTGMSRMANHG